MSLEQYAYLAEIVGVVTIVVTLIFLTLQVRQNTETMQLTNQEMWTSNALDIVKPIAMDRQVAEWWMTGWKDFEALDVVDKERHLLFEYGVLQLWWGVYQGRQQGLVGDEQWNSLLINVEMFGQRQSLQAAWSRYKSLFNDEFRNLFSKYFEQEVMSEESKEY